VKQMKAKIRIERKEQDKDNIENKIIQKMIEI
jgi:hypothetical protein